MNIEECYAVEMFLLLNTSSDYVYFDGFLPPQKQDIRLSRLEGYLKQLVTFHSVYPNGLRALPDPPKPLVIEAAHVLDSSRPVPPSFKGLPAAPFLVPTVIEALASSSFYAPMVRVVPAEADVYCAAAARAKGGAIVTSDSDMLVHDIGPNGAVAFFNQLELRKSFAGCTSIHVLICRPGEIAKRLALEDLRRLAFEIKKDPSAPFQGALQRARGYKPMGIRDAHYEDFFEEYASKPLDAGPSLTSMPANALVNPSGKWLDPRVSELVLQIAAQTKPQVKMYLPFLIDDPSRSSAWAVSSSLRRFAYSLLIFFEPEPSELRAVAEHSRKGLRIASLEVHFLTKQQSLTYAQVLEGSFFQLHNGSELTASHHLFEAYAVYMVCQWYLENDKPRPARAAWSVLLTGAAGKTLTWMEIHLSAQLQAALYSLRMLKQILRYVTMVARADIPPLLAHLDIILADMKPIERLIPSRLEVVKENPSKLETEGLLDAVFSLLGDGRAEDPKVDADTTEGSSTPDPVPSGFTQVPSNRRKKGRVTESRAIPRVSKEPLKKPNNIYRLLADP